MSKKEFGKFFNGEEIKEGMIFYRAESHDSTKEIGETTFSFTKYAFKHFTDYRGRVTSLAEAYGHVDASVVIFVVDGQGNSTSYDNTMSTDNIYYCGATKKDALAGLKKRKIDNVKQSQEVKMQYLDYDIERLMSRVKDKELEMQEERLRLRQTTTIIDLEMAKH